MYFPPWTWTRNIQGPIAPLHRFKRDEDGAVTVDWVVLVAAVLSLAIITLNTVGTAVSAANNDTARCLKIQKNIMKRDISYQKKLKRMARRCGRL